MIKSFYYIMDGSISCKRYTMIKILTKSCIVIGQLLNLMQARWSYNKLLPSPWPCSSLQGQFSQHFTIHQKNTAFMTSMVNTDGCILAFDLCVYIKKELERHLATNLTSRSHNKKEQFKKFPPSIHFHLIEGERMSCR